jgi:hypothetical protein
MSIFDYRLVCTDGEAKGHSVALRQEDLPTVARFLRASLDWALASAAGEVSHAPGQLAFVEYSEAMRQMLARGVFGSKYEARSAWILTEAA